MGRQKRLSGDGNDAGTLVLDKTDVKEPKRYSVILHNDDFTTQEFVISVLINFFQKNAVDAKHLMLKVHLEGRARVASFIKDIAESKVALITAYARQNGMPLLITAEPE